VTITDEAGGSTSSGRIPSLDGMRAIAVSFVCISHLIGGPSAPLDLGTIGVRVFFVLSGFLITTLLLHEWDQYGTINLPRFYVRRALRIFPAYYAYLAVIALADSLGVIQLHRGDLLYALTYTVNYHMPASSVFVQHAWSLAVEEQFYLLWPALLLILGRKRGLQFALLVICLAPLVRIAVHESLPDAMKGTIRYRFETVADGIAVGCALAGYRGQLWAMGWYRRLLTSAWFWLVPTGVIALSFVGSHAFQAIIGASIMNLLIVALVDRGMRFSTDPVGRLLNTRAFVATGVLSYSLYLWQQPFLASHQTGWWTALPIGVVFTVLAALVSYWAIERPFLALRQFLARPHFVRVAAVFPSTTRPPE
jgi:peptidoglycan/LPS O-acetylase OafA/YrhL